MGTEPQRILVTGSQGFVGRYLTALLAASYPQARIFGFGRSPRAHNTFTHFLNWNGHSTPAPLPPKLCVSDDGVEYLAQDILDREGLCKAIQAFQPDTVFHLASALAGDSPERLFRINAEGAIHLLEALAASRTKHIQMVYVSTGGVYGEPGDSGLPLGEGSACHPLDLYAVSKLAAEQACRALAPNSGIAVKYARVFNVMGPGQSERHVCGRLMAQIAAILHSVAMPVIELGATHPTRDFIDVRDVADALLILMQRGTVSEVYNVGSGSETSVERLLQQALQVAGLAGKVEVRRNTKHDVGVKRHYADIQRLRGLGFHCKLSLAESLRDQLSYYSALTTPQRQAVI